MTRDVERVFFERALTLVCGILRPADSHQIPKPVSVSNKRWDRIPSHCQTKTVVGLLPVVIVDSGYHAQRGLRFRKRGVDVQGGLRRCARRRYCFVCRLQSATRKYKEVAADRIVGQCKFWVQCDRLFQILPVQCQ